MSHIPKVKICGFRDGESALEAARFGADFLGFVLVEGVRRQLTPFEAQEVVRNYRIRARDHRVKMARFKGPKIVGLFRNQQARWVNKVAQQVDLDYVQLCGEEDEGYMRSMWRPVIRQIRVKSGMNTSDLLEAVEYHLSRGRHVLLDSFDEGTPGGSGKIFDWRLAEGVVDKENVLLAGGLDPVNVGSAISQLNPWGVDVSSGVESEGLKDHSKIRDFIQTAKSSI